MLQSFEDTCDPSVGPVRVAALRQAMSARGLEGYIVPRADEYQGEYLPAGSERLRWLTGFAGSAGTAIVLIDSAALFVDGRYTVQAPDEVDPAVFEIRQVPGEKISAWLLANAAKGARIGYDPKLFTIAWIENLETALAKAGIALAPLDDNLIDRLWTDRPLPPLGRVVPQPIEFAGVAADRKLADLQARLAKNGEDAMILTLPDSIAWLLNIRGSDIAYTPFALSFAVAPASGRLQWFVDPRKVDATARAHVAAIADIASPDHLLARLAALGAAKAKVRIDPHSASKWFADAVTEAGASVSRDADPCQLAKARKNPAELAGARASHLRDGVAVCRLLAWLAREAPSGRLDEIAVATQLETFRHETGALRDLSFDTISAAGPHAAIPHYRVSRRSNSRIEANSVFLLDSGGQYQDGTTDITRTVAVGDVGAEARERFTLVLKGMIAVSLARFPAGTRGCDLDPLARQALWAAGLDFDHGTGHGIGSYLSVHEGPQRIARTGMDVLEPGMIVSNEPGYYKAGAFGIRIENLIVVTPLAQVPGGDRPMHAFETLTLAPIDRHMIVAGALSDQQRTWFDAYHMRVRTDIGPRLGDQDRAWLEDATAAL